MQISEMLDKLLSLSKFVDEIVELYDIDGLYFDELSFQSWCKCENCNTLFRKEYGIDIPSNTDDKFIIF